MRLLSHLPSERKEDSLDIDQGALRTIPEQDSRTKTYLRKLRFLLFYACQVCQAQQTIPPTRLDM